MIGAFILIALMVLVFPVGMFLSGAVVAGLHGFLHTKDAEARFEGSELVELSRK